MEFLQIRNAHQGLVDALDLLKRKGYERDSRYGRVLKIDGPVALEYSHPKERVLFWPQRDANPFFHLFEALYLLGGRCDVAWIAQFAKRMSEFSDDGKTFHGSYGRRWRSWFGVDQIQAVIDILRKNPNDRRCVVQMWDAKKDLGKQGKDFPCNTQIYFSVNRDGKLDMTVTQRSGDLIWGILGANCVHMSVLQEYVAAGTALPMGRYFHFTNDFHAYLQFFEPLKNLAAAASDPYRISSNNPYVNAAVLVTDIVDLPVKEWTEDLLLWLEDPFKIGLRSSFFRRVATPMLASWKAYKKGDIKQAVEIVKEQMPPHLDWQTACREWLERRMV